MCSIKSLIRKRMWLVLLSGSFTVNAQDEFTALIRADLIYTFRPSTNWQLTGSLFPEIFWLRPAEEDVNQWKIDPFSLNFQLGASYRLTNLIQFSGGYLLAWRDLDALSPDVENRLMEQFVFTERSGKFRLRQRFRAEQRYFKNGTERPVHRLRFQVSVDLPLEGERLDAREAYINTQVEWLFNMNREQTFFYRETRIYGSLGWQLNNKQRFETGPELRPRILNEDKDRLLALFWRMALFLN